MIFFKPKDCEATAPHQFIKLKESVKESVQGESQKEERKPT
jgi:hypothetical protein